MSALEFITRWLEHVPERFAKAWAQADVKLEASRF